MLNRKRKEVLKHDSEPKKHNQTASRVNFREKQRQMVDENTGELVEHGGLGTITLGAYKMRLLRKKWKDEALNERKKWQNESLNKELPASSGAAANEQSVSSAAAVPAELGSSAMPVNEQPASSAPLANEQSVSSAAAVPAELGSSAMPANEQPASSTPLANEIADPFVAVAKKINHITQIATQLMSKINSNELQPQEANRLSKFLVDLNRCMGECPVLMHELASLQSNPSLTPELEDRLNLWVKYVDRILAQQVQEANQAQQAELQARRQQQAYQAYRLLQAHQRQVQQAQREEKAVVESFLDPQYWDEASAKRQRRI